MITKIEWRARVTGTEKVDDLLDFAQEVKRGLLASQLVPDEAIVVNVNSSFMELPEVTVAWHSENEMAYEPRYTP